MTPDYHRENVRLFCGDSNAILPHVGTVDAVVTDPPYGLSFMGKSWDYDVPETALWKLALDALRPGGHLLAFAGTRTQHRMAVRIEDAGFEIRDMLAWVYGSGFPKSLDVSKAIDKSQGENRNRQLQFTAWMRSTGITRQQIDDATQTVMGSHYLTSGQQPQIPTAEHFDKLRHLLPEIPEEIEMLVAERTGIEWTAYKNRPVVGTKTGLNTKASRIGCSTAAQGLLKSPTHEFNVTAPATAAAHQWSGWGTALKPALEPITLARKPLDGTVAENVLEHGTGALNVDGCRVGSETLTYTAGETGGASGKYGTRKRSEHPTTVSGRWPANLIHNGSEEVVAVFPSDGDASASRFFYCAKASREDRDEGLDGFEMLPAPKNGHGLGDAESLAKRMKSNGHDNVLRRNIHATVKPTDLMRYLCRLVTPPGGIVLDPFMGSGSTGKAAILEGFGFVGIELDRAHFDIAVARIEHAFRLRDEARKVANEAARQGELFA